MNQITIYGRPIALKRTRIAGKRCYDSQKHEKPLVYLEVKKQWQALNLPLFIDPIKIEMLFQFAVPINTKYT